MPDDADPGEPAQRPRTRTIAGAGADGSFGVRFESIGGLGAHLAGQILAEAGILRGGLNGAQFSSYGSEKKGSPIRSFVRFCPGQQAIRRSDPIERPQLVVVFHQALIGRMNVIAGLVPAGTVVVNTAVSPDQARERLGLRSGTVGVIDGLRIALEESTRVNSTMLGAATRACPFLDPESVRETLAERLGRRYPQLVEANLRAFARGFDELRAETWPPAVDEEPSLPDRPTPAYGYLEAPIGGTILESGSSVVRDLSASREGFLPSLDLQKCVHCGLCDVVCPDLCFVWEAEGDGTRLRGIDYQYCKGCLKCTVVCPTGALTEIREEEGWAAAHRVPLFAVIESAGVAS
ncbi:MAG: 2-oxoacid:acceptor oxidoreductase family protein [Gaiellaceae bacterium]